MPARVYASSGTVLTFGFRTEIVPLLRSISTHLLVKQKRFFGVVNGVVRAAVQNRGLRMHSGHVAAVE